MSGPERAVGGAVCERLNGSSQALNQLLLPNCGSKGDPSAITELMPYALSDRGFLIPYLRFILSRRFISSETGSHKAAPNHPVCLGGGGGSAQRATVESLPLHPPPLPPSATFTSNSFLISRRTRWQFRRTRCHRGRAESMIVIYEIKILPQCGTRAWKS